jgi:hypothetical protein
MKKKTIIILVIILLLCGSLSLLFVFKGRELFPNWDLSFLPNISSSVENGQPMLELEVSDFPESIDTICQKVEFKVEAKNTGDGTLKYTDIESGNYMFTLLNKERLTIISSTLNNSQGTHNLYLKDFGEIKPNGKKVLIFSTKETYIGDIDLSYQNGFNMLQDSGNGPRELVFGFNKNNGGDSYTMLSNRPEFSTNIQAFVKSGEYWTNKVCN